jgi:anti-sigma factor RsiW
MSRIPRLTAEQRAELVAYLDGELEEDETREIEQTLAASEVARHEVEMLSRTWDLLEALPRATASSEFASKTLETVKIEAAPAAAPEWRPYARGGLIALGWLTALCAAVLLGFTAGHRLIPREDDAVVRDLPLLERLDAYREVGSVEFLKELDDHNLTLNPPGRSP